MSWASLLAGAPFLVVGALLGGWAQTALFAGALLVDWIGTYVTSRQGNWRVYSAAHWSGLFVLLAIGESVAAIGVGAGAHGGFYAPALFGGAALYLGGHVLFGNRLHATVKVPRLVTVAVLLVALPGAIAVPPLVALGALVLVLAGLIAFETRQYAEQRRELRQ
ncbi:hypothetical protein GCM10009850_019910 [Nonomuraea monospora]|uniref:Low temperature requirement protein A n=1 Tax=Nonomuraea monospora TaxID=568818 RepID=A0ABN3CAY4_9ACTN